MASISSTGTALISLVVVVTLLGLASVLYSSRVQQSKRYQATVVPLANIMDIGFVAMTPIIVSIVGIRAALLMLGLCLLGIAMGWVMRLNIKRFEPVADESGLTRTVSRTSQLALIAASLVNVAYYLQLMGAVVIFLIVFPSGIENVLLVFGRDSTGAGVAVLSLVALGSIGYFFGLEELNNLGNKTTAFNLAAVTAIIVGFVAYNLITAAEGTWTTPRYNPPLTTTGLRQILGFFAIVQGFEASRYIGEQYSAKRRISTMRIAQIIATIAFVLFPLTAMTLFAEVQPEPRGFAVVQIAAVASPVLPWLVLALAIGSQASASVNAISSRSAVLLDLTNGRVPKRFTYPALALGALAVVLVTDVLSAVAVASRVFAAFFTLQCSIGLILAVRDENWPRAVGITLVGIAMLTIAIFGLPS
ncbi:hypothetical protein [Haloarchaeobius baliensis]|uniref:hypothetical protein n=1 Tax=Haloarchaeobius baliensis TaxID=1670458 RepID=UPI003F88090B